MDKNTTPKHLYIHIPFCKSICTYCDFVRSVSNDKTIESYLIKIIKQINKIKPSSLLTIYVGGGTPNSLNFKHLNLLLKSLKKKLAKTYEFTTECNPSLITQKQAELFKKNKVNRISLGVQTLNDKILKQYNRKQTKNDVINAINILYKVGLSNVSVDFMYGFNEMLLSDLDEDFKFIKDYKIKHVSFYSLECKENSVISKQGYQLDENKINDQFEYIVNKMKSIGYERYEVSNWTIDKKHESKHNICYWNTNNWIGIGFGAFGLENRNYYSYVGNVNNFKKHITKLSNKDYYFQIISMGLRLVNGIDLTIQRNNDAYRFFKTNLDGVKIVNNRLIAKNINQLNNILEKIL